MVEYVWSLGGLPLLSAFAYHPHRLRSRLATYRLSARHILEKVVLADKNIATLVFVPTRRNRHPTIL